MIKTKSIYDEISEEDGIRVLVTRYWPRGIKKEQKDYWFRDLGPEAGLIKKWKAEEIPWEEFRKSYLDEFRSKEKTAHLEELKGIIKSTKGVITLLCTCREEEHCHRNILKEMLLKK